MPWKPLGNAPWGVRAFSSAAAYDGKIWLIAGAGLDDVGELLWGDMWTTMDGVAWTHLNDFWGTEVTDGIFSAASVVHDGWLYLMGGYSFTDTYLEDGFRKLTTPDPDEPRKIYKIATDGTVTRVDVQIQWEGEIYTKSAVSFNGKVWLYPVKEYGVTGALPGEKIFYTTDPTTPWDSNSINVPPRRMASMIEFNDKLWIMGGQIIGGSYINEVWSSEDGINWTLVTPNAGWHPRGRFTTVVWKGAIWLMGGEHYDLSTDTYTYFNDVWSSKDGVNWAKVEDAPWVPRFAHSAVVYKGEIWLFGGVSL